MKHIKAYWFTIIFVIVIGAYVIQSISNHKTKTARVSDLRVLTQICIRTNINSTQALVAYVEKHRIRLKIPIPADPSKPCFVLANIYDPSHPQKVMLQETNVKSDTIYYSLMTGEVGFQRL